MTVQQYLQIENNVVTNIVMWDGNTDTWQPPANATMVVDENIPAWVWQAVYTDKKITDYVLIEIVGAGEIGFIWDGTVLTTNQPKPAIPTEVTL